MNEYIDTLKRYVAEHPPNYGKDAHTILEMLYCYYHECDNCSQHIIATLFSQILLEVFFKFRKQINAKLDCLVLVFKSVR